jgi:hypothetical protein
MRGAIIDDMPATIDGMAAVNARKSADTVTAAAPA